MFVGHGSYAVEHDKDIIVFIAKGAWNVEASRNAIALISRYVDRLTPQEFAIVADTREVEGITPQSADVWSEAVREWLNKIGFQGFEHDLPKPKFLDGLENQ
ncbi:hypothetical protein [Bowmanella dokdonensis]|uniref:Uncharacterized protein n=1 Tax=Bowmanella dokdonensis TaxID=751969 RepID=A0A939IT71_9ALTE|nr:hypothetical protein [Bowmanella dokdonensis]MBN7827161.1 hypothetical protein [Bowmanella dokdonensis]